MTTTVFSTGYQGRSVDDLCAALVAANVEVLVDVRQRAWSQRPEFRKTALANKLKAAGIDYFHLKEAGNPFRPRKGEDRSFAACAREYRKHLRQHPTVIERAVEIIKTQPVALFCYEAENKSCHRSILIQEARRVLGHLEMCEV